MLRVASALTAAQAFWLGAVSKAVAVTITYPPNLGRTVIQARSKSGDGSNSSPYTQDTVVGVMAAIYGREGFAGATYTVNCSVRRKTSSGILSPACYS